MDRVLLEFELPMRGFPDWTLGVNKARRSLEVEVDFGCYRDSHRGSYALHHTKS